MRDGLSTLLSSFFLLLYLALLPSSFSLLSLSVCSFPSLPLARFSSLSLPVSLYSYFLFYILSNNLTSRYSPDPAPDHPYGNFSWEDFGVLDLSYPIPGRLASMFNSSLSN